MTHSRPRILTFALRFSFLRSSCMHFMTVAYFLTYHTTSTAIIRRTGFGRSSKPGGGIVWPKLLVQVFAMAYITAVMEAWTISAFPHYVSARGITGETRFSADSTHIFSLSQRYPDMRTMLVYGSAFYSLMFMVTFPAYALLDETPSSTRTLRGFVEHSLACGMAVRQEERWVGSSLLITHSYPLRCSPWMTFGGWHWDPWWRFHRRRRLICRMHRPRRGSRFCCGRMMDGRMK